MILPSHSPPISETNLAHEYSESDSDLDFEIPIFFNQVANPTKSVATHLAKPIQKHIILADTYADFATKTIPKLIDLSKLWILLSFLVSENY